MTIRSLGRPAKVAGPSERTEWVAGFDVPRCCTTGSSARCRMIDESVRFGRLRVGSSRYQPSVVELSGNRRNSIHGGDEPLFLRISDGMKEPVRRLWEQALVLRCQAGDDRAFEELIVAFHDRLKNYVDHVLGNPGNAEDVLQDVWFDVYRKLPSLRSPQAIRSWLFRIVRNKNAHHFRRDRIRTEPVDVAELADRSEPEPTFRDEDLRLISECVASLSTEHREVVVLRYMEGMSYEEIARIADCPVGTVRSRLYYAKRVLKEEMKRLRNDTP